MTRTTEKIEATEATTVADDNASPDIDGQSQLENAIATVWSEALQLPRVGREDNFFDLGGHSLLAVQVQHMTRQALRTDIQLADIFAYPTVRKLATYLGRSGERGTVEVAAEDRSQLRGSLSRRRNLRQKIRTSTRPKQAENDDDRRSRGTPFVNS